MVILGLGNCIEAWVFAVSGLCGALNGGAVALEVISAAHSDDDRCEEDERQAYEKDFERAVSLISTCERVRALVRHQVDEGPTKDAEAGVGDTLADMDPCGVHISLCLKEEINSKGMRPNTKSLWSCIPL